MPVDLGTTTGVTRDVSASGVFFETDVPYTLGNEISFAMDLETAGGKMVLRCRGEIVRVKPGDGKVGVAVKITESVIEPAK